MPSSPQTGRNRDRVDQLRSLFLVIATLLMCAAAVQYAAHGFSALAVPYSLFRIEAFVLEGAMRVARDAPLFLPTDAAPTKQIVYNYLTYALPAGRTVGLWISALSVLLMTAMFGFRGLRRRPPSSPGTSAHQ